MKRCPQCEFIYEDDQSLCDMDGVLLVFDSRALPNLHALAPVPAKRQPRRNRAVPVFASLILVLVLGLVYYVSIQSRATQITETPHAASTSNAAPPLAPTPEAQPSVASEAPTVEEPKPAPSKEPTPASSKKPAVKAVSGTGTKTSTEPKKEESKVGSILKKTGRILKKPFKF